MTIECTKPCAWPGVCLYIERRGGRCHWQDTAPGWHDLSRTGKLIWLHAWKTEPRKQS